MNPRNDEPTGGLNWLREDMREIRTGFVEMKETFGRVEGTVDRIGKQLDKHCADPQAHGKRQKDSGTSIVPPTFRGNWLTAARVIVPILLAMMFGLLGLGFYMGSGGSTEETTRALRAVSDTTAKLAKDVARIEGAISGAAEPVDPKSED